MVYVVYFTVKVIMGVFRMNFEDKRSHIILLLICAVIIFFAGIKYENYTNESNEPYVEVSADEKNIEDIKLKKEEKIKVHVAGAVFNSGLFEFEQGARCDDAVRKANALPEADLDRLNLAAPLNDGQQVYVYFKNKNNNGEIIEKDYFINDSNNKIININNCTAKKLEELPGIGTTYAKRIVDYRNKNGLFDSIDELLNVSGIGEKRLESIKDLVTLY